MWRFSQPVEIVFGNGVLEELPKELDRYGWKQGVLVISNTFHRDGYGERLMEACKGRIKDCFFGIEPNPTLENVDACAAKLRDCQAEFVVALGGGSVLDCAKAAAVVSCGRDSVSKYHGTKNALPEKGIPVIAIPTTAGTGSEVTCVSVLTDRKTKRKAPLNAPQLYPRLALIDPELTYGASKNLTAYSGLDALSHALESYWGKGHMPACEPYSQHSCRLIFKYLRKAVEDGRDVRAREKMAEASLLAGLAFNLPKNTVCHACSFPLTNLYHIPHGEACALTLDYVCRFNAEAEGGRLHKLARSLGFADAYAMADEISEMKREFGVRMDLRDLKLSPEQVDELVQKSKHPLLENNPIPFTEEELYKMYETLL